MSQNYDACKVALRSMNQHGHSEIIVSKEIPQDLKQPNVQEQEGLQDADKVLLPKIRLYEAVNKMGPTEVKCLVLKLDKFDEDKYSTFCLLKNFRDPAVVTLQAFCEDACLPRIALSFVDTRLDDLVRSDLGPSMFFENAKIGEGRSLSAVHRRFIINMCTGLDSLFKEGIYPREIKIDDLYVCRVGSQDECLKMLILSADQIRDTQVSSDRKIKLWGDVKEVARQIKRITDNTDARSISKKQNILLNKIKSPPFSAVAKSFIRYIGYNTSMLKRYPDDWSYRQKAEYLFSIISANQGEICTRLQRPGVLLKWPVDPNTKKLPDVLRELIDNDRKRTYPTGYQTNVPYDYVLLCRTTYKHFDSLCTKVTSLKKLCKKPAEFLEKMEEWQPDIWCILYDAIGLPDEPRGK